MTHPGVVLLEKLNNAKISRKELALRTGVTEKHICTIVNGEKPISVSFARKLGYVFENSDYWINLQTKYENEQLRIQEENNISQEELNILKSLHEIIDYFIERKYIHNNCSDVLKVIQIREFLKISDLRQIPKITYNAAYRAQLATNIKIDPYVLFSWQRLCEKETEHIMVTQTLDKGLLRSRISEIKKLMFGQIDEGIQKLQNIFSDCGIAFQVVKNFRGAPVQGFIKESIDNKIILCLTIRGKRADRFWFTLFHEIAHILNGDYKTRFVDFDSVKGEIEELADKYARDTLINPYMYRNFILSSDCVIWENIVEFANVVGVKPFIVLGRLQNDGYLDWTDYTDKIVKYQWA